MSRRGSKRSSRTKSRHCPYPGILANGQTRFYRTIGDAARAERDSRYLANRKRNETDRVIRTKVTRFDRDPATVFDFHGRVNENEREFLRWADGHGVKVGRNGWPDFFCESPSGGTAGVEVKANHDTLSEDQIRCFTFLEAVGVPVFIFHASWSSSRNAPPLVPWREYLADVRSTNRPGMDLGGKAVRRSKTSGKQGLDLRPPHENLTPEERIPEVLGDPPTIH